VQRKSNACQTSAEHRRVSVFGLRERPLISMSARLDSHPIFYSSRSKTEVSVKARVSQSTTECSAESHRTISSAWAHGLSETIRTAHRESWLATQWQWRACQPATSASTNSSSTTGTSCLIDLISISYVWLVSSNSFIRSLTPRTQDPYSTCRDTEPTNPNAYHHLRNDAVARYVLAKNDSSDYNNVEPMEGRRRALVGVDSAGRRLVRVGWLVL